ncbi:MAG: hypothetical protein RL272_137 [Candidatus Parcubacteria bacterium]|jgi:hypothetical protein
MGDVTVPTLLCVLVAAAATAWLIHAYVPSREAFLFRRMLAVLAVRRVFRACRHAFDRDARRLDRYSRAMVDLATAIELRDGVERRLAESFGPDGPRAAGTLAEFDMLERHLERSRERALRYLSSMPDEDIAIVARVYQQGTLEGLVSIDAVAAFFRDERDLVRAMPHMIAGHFDRMTHRFNALSEEAAAAPLARPTVS